MGNVTYWKSERRRARTALRNYFVNNSKQVEEEYQIEIPANIKNLSGEEFSNWLKTVRRTLLSKNNSSELYLLIAQYSCACTNLRTAENSIFSL